MYIKIPSDCEKIHILFSGGMDSSILLYLLSKQLKKENRDIPIHCYTMPNVSSHRTVLRITKWFEERNYHFTNLLLRKQFLIRDLVENILTVNVGYVYTGCNKVVEDKFTPTVYIEHDTPPFRGQPFGEKHIRPFIDMDKREVMELYIKENVMDLLAITRSCGSKISFESKKCGGCYFCMERQWAADMLGIEDKLL